VPGRGPGGDELRRHNGVHRQHELLDGQLHGGGGVAVLVRLGPHGVEDDVDPSLGGDDSFEVGVDGLLVECVQRGDVGDCLAVGDRISHRLHVIQRSTGQEQARTLPCELVGHLGADLTSCTEEDGDLVLQP
jgi:hypothetical protein